MRPYAALAAMLLIILGGCFASLPAWVPASEPVAWQTPSLGIGAATAHGCGFCSGDPTQPEHEVLAWYPGGSIALIEWGRADGDQTIVQFHARVTPDQKVAARAVWRELELPTDRVKIHFVTLTKLAPVDAREVALVFDDAVRLGGEAEGEIDATDCGPNKYWLRGESTLMQQSFGCGITGGDGWQLAAQQLRILSDWAASS